MRVRTLDALALLKTSSLSKFVHDEIIDKLRDRLEVQAVLKGGVAKEGSVLGKRKERPYEVVLKETEDAMEETKKRVKYYQEQTEVLRKITMQGFEKRPEYERLLDEYNSQRKEGAQFNVIGAPKEDDKEVEEE